MSLVFTILGLCNVFVAGHAFAYGAYLYSSGMLVIGLLAILLAIFLHIDPPRDIHE